MGRPQEPLGRDGTPLREFAFWLRDLRDRSGLTYELLAKRTSFSVATMHEAMSGRRLPSRPVLRAIVTACGGDEAQWDAYWTQVKRLLDPSAPPGINRSILPPWAAQEAVDSGSRVTAVAGQGFRDRDDDWYIESFSTVLRLDGDQVEAWEWRRIVSNVDGLAEIVASVNVPRHPDASEQAPHLKSELVYGGLIESRQHPYDGYFQTVIALPRPLAAGEGHEYCTLQRLPAGQRMAPHYTHVPYRRSDSFDLRVRFGPDRAPSLVWRLDGAPATLVYRQVPSDQVLVPNKFGEIHVSFGKMSPGLGYGISWHDKDPASAL
jgi:transcriptional regulator with XRE-family HTH domain